MTRSIKWGWLWSDVANLFSQFIDTILWRRQFGKPWLVLWNSVSHNKKEGVVGIMILAIQECQK